MVLEAKNTTLAYRCPQCGKNILSMVGVFALTGDLIKLKCDCGESELTIQHQKDGKVRLSVPCFFCPRPHQYVLSPNVFFSRELFSLECAYSGLDICFVGSQEKVLEATASSDAAFAEMLKNAGITDLSQLREEQEEEDDFLDPQVESIAALTVENALEEGKLYCNCPAGTERDVQFEFLADSLLIYCKTCGATRIYPVSNMTTAMAFMDIKEIDLRDN